MKPLAPKDIKSQAVDEKKHPSELKPALKVAQPVQTKSGTVTPKAKAKSGSPNRERKFAFDDQHVHYCIKDMSKHYGIETSVKNCKSNCANIHYSQIPKALNEAAASSNQAGN